MSRYETRTTDRRAAYYGRIAPIIAADPLNFYVRAERGRKLQIEIYMKRPKIKPILVSLPDNVVKFTRTA